MIKTDCFGYKPSRECSALKKLYCKTEKCPFYKTKEAFEEDLKRYPVAKKKELRA